MKTFLEFITEATFNGVKVKDTAFTKKFKSLVGMVATHGAAQSGIHPAVKATENHWRLTGHVGDTHTTREIADMKRKVFGSGGENSEIYWVHHTHGLIKTPAHGNETHRDHEEGYVGKLSPKHEMAIRKPVARGRIEHHGNNRGSITLTAETPYHIRHAMGVLRQHYPHYKIHNGHGQEFDEVNEEESTFSRQFKNLHNDIKTMSKARMKTDPTTPHIIHAAARSPHLLTGHHGDAHSTREIADAKRRVFGSGGENSELFWHHKTHGIVTVPVTPNTTHDVHEYEEGGVLSNDVARSLRDPRALNAKGRIEHFPPHHRYDGIISLMPQMGGNLRTAIREMERKYPGYKIHDGTGAEYTKEDVSKVTKTTLIIRPIQKL
jgi:hypothetical protein